MKHTAQQLIEIHNKELEYFLYANNILLLYGLISFPSLLNWLSPNRILVGF